MKKLLLTLVTAILPLYGVSQIFGDSASLCGVKDGGTYIETNPLTITNFSNEDLYKIKKLTFCDVADSKMLMLIREMAGSGNREYKGEGGQFFTEDTPGSLESIDARYMIFSNNYTYKKLEDQGQFLYLYPENFEEGGTVNNWSRDYWDYRRGGILSVKTLDGKNAFPLWVNSCRYLFAYCKRLKEVVMPIWWKEYKTGCFKNCPQLQRVVFPVYVDSVSPYGSLNPRDREPVSPFEDCNSSCKEQEIVFETLPDVMHFHFFKGLQLSKVTFSSWEKTDFAPKMVIPINNKSMSLDYSKYENLQNIIDSLIENNYIIDKISYYITDFNLHKRERSQEDFDKLTIYYDENGNAHRKSCEDLIHEYADSIMRNYTYYTEEDSIRIIGRYNLRGMLPITFIYYHKPTPDPFNENCIIYVDARNVDAFRRDKFWGQYEIRAIDWPTSIYAIQANVGTSGELIKEYYSIDGRRLAQPQKGLNIVKISDGTTQKLYIK